MNFSRFLDIQSWWEVPSIAYFCSLFRTAFNLLDFDIEELEEALLTDGTEDGGEESASSLLTELIVRLLSGCLGSNDISAFNYQMYLRRLFRRKCQELNRYNPFDSDIDFQFLPLRTKVEILYALCDFRLDADDVFDLFKNLEAESLRVEPLGWDSNNSAYWYFYGTRLYREDITKKPKGKTKRKKNKESKKRGWFYEDDWFNEEDTDRVWQVVCFTEDDWTHLTEKFSKATSKVEKELYRSLSQNFLPEIPRLFQEKERLQRKRHLELAPRRTSSRVLQKIKQKEEESKQSSTVKTQDDEDSKQSPDRARENRAKRRNLLRSQSDSSNSLESSQSEDDEMPQKISKQAKGKDKRSKNSSATHKGEPPPPPPLKTGRKTNNSLASATGQIVIPENDEPINSTRKKLKTSQIFSQTEEDIQTDMYKVLEQLTAHDDAWPFMDPVEEEYAPNYYAVIRRPMDLHKMEERLDNGYYTDFSMFKADFKLIVNNCRLYNGQDNEYTMMVDNLQAAFDRLTEKYMHRLSSSDEEIAVEYQLPTPSRKHKLKSSESPSRHKKKKHKYNSDSDPAPIIDQENLEENYHDAALKKSKESHKTKTKKKRKGHHRHGKHSKNHHKKGLHKAEHDEKIKRSKKQKHTKNKDKDSKKSKQKKKKSRNPEPDPNERRERSVSQESFESSNRSRSASPLPSIHTLTPSPTELDVADAPDSIIDPEFYKDKYDKIKERRRHVSKKEEAWESLFDYKHKLVDKQKQNLHIPEKDKNQKLRETIEKLRAKNEKYKSNSAFNSLFTPSHSSTDKNSDSNNAKDGDFSDFSDLDDDNDTDNKKGKASRKGLKKNAAKNESASEALEQAVKDISKWLDEAPKGSAASSPCDSPAQTISTEDHENSRLDDDLSQGEKLFGSRKEQYRKRPSSREPKMIKRREIQRTIDRLQPGKSKGNLLTNISNKNTEKVEEPVPPGPFTKVRDIDKGEESPKLSLGSVLPTVDFSLGNDHGFGNKEVTSADQCNDSKSVVTDNVNKQEDSLPVEKKIESVVPPVKKDAEVETEPPPSTKPSQEKATPNLSAWFKAFGAPKTTGPSTGIKKKLDDPEIDDKTTDNPSNEKPASPKTAKYDSPTDPETPNTDGGDSPLPNVSATPRQRRTSTGSSVSERSSYSQDLDSPRHQMSHTSPLVRSPASPRTDDFQKITYPIINGTVRAGFYQDTTSIKSSPDKSCSPREAPQSPYSPYSQHVYVSNSVMGSSTPNYFVDHNKSPLPTYSQNPPTYYDTTKVTNSKSSRAQEDFPSIGAESFQQNQFGDSFSPAPSPYSQTHSVSYSQPQTSPINTTDSLPPAIPDPKTALFPVKKRTYNEPEQASLSTKKALDSRDVPLVQIKNDYQKITTTLNMSSISTPSVDDIALALSEKSEMVKLRDKNNAGISDQHGIENKDNVAFDNSESVHSSKKNITTSAGLSKNDSINKKENVDMVNMGYMNPEDRRSSGELHDEYLAAKTNNMNPQQKTYDIDAIAINLGMSNQHLSKALGKAGNIPPAHSHDRAHGEGMAQNIAHAHHAHYEALSNSQSMNKFSLNDIELANKKLFASSTTSQAPLDYGNWKMSSQMRKPEVSVSDYSSVYSTNTPEKLKADMGSSTSAINYNKNLQQQYSSYNIPRQTAQNMPSELRIPNPRGLLKNDHVNISSSIADTDIMSKNIEKSQKSDKHVQNHPYVSSIPYKTPYSTHSSLPIDSLRNLPNIPQMLERYTNDERYLSSFAGSGSSLYHDKTFQMAQMFNKSMPTDMHAGGPSVSMYNQTSPVTSKDSNIYKTSTASSQVDAKAKTKRKRTSDTKANPVSGSQGYTASCGTEGLPSVKSSMMPGSAFNFGTSTNMTLGGGLYADNAGFSLEDFRNSNQLMAANYMAAVAHQQRNSAELNTEKLVKPAHQNSSHTSGSFPFIGHPQVRAGYPFVGADSSSPLYQQYLQRHQEELLRQTGAQIMSLYPPGYPSSLGVRQPYDSINRPSWL